MGIMATSGDVASATTATIGALTAAAAGGTIGAVDGAVKGFSRGLSTGSRSAPIAVLGMAAIGAAGIIDWPILIAGGAAALLLRQLRHTSPTESTTPTQATSHTGATFPTAATTAPAAAVATVDAPAATDTTARRQRSRVASADIVVPGI